MTRTLRAVDGEALPAALEAALAGTGDAVFCGSDPGDLGAQVPHNVALVVQSSGSTARPKRVMLSADALLASAAASASALGGQGQWVLALPTSYIAGINVLVRSIAAGTVPVTLSPGHFDPDDFVKASARLEAPLRFVSLVPAQLARLFESEQAVASLRRFDRVLLGGQAAPPALMAQAQSLGVAVTRTYGSSETAGGCVYDGVPIGTTQLRVSDGEIEVSGRVLSEGYLGDAELTDDRFRADDRTRWYRTGDTGVLVDGVLSVTGRLDDVIISGGVKVSLGELESLVRRESPLHDAVVVGAADDRWGHVPVVVSTVEMPLEDLRNLVVAEFGRAAAPARLEVVSELPLLASGKPDRLSIRASLSR